jgi:hypothetical protein
MQKQFLMKISNALIYVLITAWFLSCSSDKDNDDNSTPVNPNLALSTATISGNWKIVEIIKSNGTRVPYIHLCSTKEDFIKFYTYPKMEFHQTYSDCGDVHLNEGCTNYIIYANNIMGNCGQLIDGTVSHLTASQMQIDYGEVRNFPYPDNNLSSAVGLVLVRE